MRILGSVEVMFAKDILLDDEKFKKASEQFAALADDMSKLRQDIDNLLKELESGFDTPAGRKFIKSCKSGLLQPMDDQAAVIKHVSDNLVQARAKYESVFIEFEALNNAIKNQQ